MVDWLEEVVKVLARFDAKDATEGMAEALFSPGTACRDRIIALLRSANRYVDICVFTITDNAISQAISAAHRKGVQVRIITDDDKSQDRGSDVDDLAREGVLVATDLTQTHMHHKFSIFDQKVLLNGSYNWTRSAFTQNQENVLVTDNTGLVATYQQEFDRLWKELG